MSHGTKIELNAGDTINVTNNNSPYFGHELLIIQVSNLVDAFDKTVGDYITVELGKFLDWI